MRAMIVDDEAPALGELIYLLSRYGAVEIAGAFTASASALCRAYGLTCFSLTCPCPE